MLIRVNQRQKNCSVTSPALSEVEGFSVAYIVFSLWQYTTFVESPLQIHLFLKKQTQFFLVFGPKTAIYPKNKPKTNPIQTQSNPICTRPKMSLCPFIIKRYENIRLYDRNENEPKTNPIFSLRKAFLVGCCNTFKGISVEFHI